MKVVRENQGRSLSRGPIVKYLHFRRLSRRRGWGDRIGKDDPAGTISLRGWLL